MKGCFICCLFLIISSIGICQANSKKLLSELGHVMEESATYDSKKVRYIEELKLSLTKKENQGPDITFVIYSNLFEAYKVFNYDSAYHYARELQQTALSLGDPTRLIYAKIKMG